MIFLGSREYIFGLACYHLCRRGAGQPVPRNITRGYPSLGRLVPPHGGYRTNARRRDTSATWLIFGGYPPNHSDEAFAEVSLAAVRHI
jgi:hypothetical protein